MESKSMVWLKNNLKVVQEDGLLFSRELNKNTEIPLGN
jgi:hypothetical protein